MPLLVIPATCWCWAPWLCSSAVELLVVIGMILLTLAWLAQICRQALLLAGHEPGDGAGDGAGHGAGHGAGNEKTGL